jgi:hypothetical protein
MFVDINVRYLWKSDLVSLKKRQKIFLEVHDDIKAKQLRHMEGL